MAVFYETHGGAGGGTSAPAVIVCQAARVEYHVLFAGISVGDFDAGIEWYERFFGRPPDVVAHDEEVMWHVTSDGWLYVMRDPARAGSATVAIAVPSLAEALRRLEASGVSAGEVEHVGDTARKAVVRDPEGNSISLVEVSEGA
ncbi:MAG: VOC family protein [Acidimicrobiales bacterium]